MKKIFTVFAILLCSGPSLAQSGSQAFTSSGTFTVPTGVTSITIEVVGAGGTGGSNGGGGGGGGGYAKGVFAVTPGATLPVNIGSPGSGSAIGTTSVSTLISATGGANGTSVPNPNIGGGGAGGTGINGNIVNRTGGNGGGAYWTYFGGGGGGAGGSTANGSNGGNSISYTPGACLTPGGSAGTGGGAPGGNGGKGAGFTDNSCNNTDPSAPGSNYGGGGGGANGNGGGASSGAPGYCFISWGAGPCVAPASPTNSTSQANLIICASGNTTLLATSTGTVYWFSAASGGSTIGIGSTFITAPLTTTTTFYAEAQTCTNSISRTPFTVSVNPLPFIAALTTTNAICSGSQAILTAGGGISYTWSPFTPGAMSFSTGANTTVSPQTTTDYTVTGIDPNGCKNSTVLTVTVFALPSLSVIVTTSAVCSGNAAYATVFTNGAPVIAWLPYNPNTLTITATTATLKPLSTITYTTLVFNTNGCMNQASTTIQVNALPNVSVASTRSIMCRGEDVSLTASGATAYLWSTGSSSSTIAVGNLTNDAVFSVTATASNGCTKTVQFTQFVVPCTGIATGNFNSEKLRIYPNPNKGEFTVTGNANVELTIVNELGLQIRNFNLDDNNNHSFLIKNLAAGIYFIGNNRVKKETWQKIVVTD